MNKKTLKILEYEKIINMLVDMASSEPAKRLCNYSRLQIYRKYKKIRLIPLLPWTE